MFHVRVNISNLVSYNILFIVERCLFLLHVLGPCGGCLTCSLVSAFDFADPRPLLTFVLKRSWLYTNNFFLMLNNISKKFTPAVHSFLFELRYNQNISLLAVIYNMSFRLIILANAFQTSCQGTSEVFSKILTNSSLLFFNQ